MNSLPYGSISPTFTFHKWPNETASLTEAPLCVSVPEVRSELPVYDTISDALISRKISAAQRAVEGFLNRDTTLRERRSLWVRPQRTISLPYGPHEILQVEQQLQPGVAFTNITDYKVIGMDYLEIQLEYLYPTRVRYNSGGEVDPLFSEAVLQETSFYYKNRNDPNEEQPPLVNGVSAITMNLLSNYVR